MSALATLVLALCAFSAGLVVLLVALRMTSDRREARRSRRQAVVRDQVLTLVLGEEDEARAAEQHLLALDGRHWDEAEDQVFTMLPKISGEARTMLIGLVTARGAAARAVRLLQSRSAVRRCRGAHRLGALRSREAVPALLGHLTDRSFLVRRVAVRALGAIGEPAVVTEVLAVCADDPRLTRDVVHALERIGSPGAEAMRAAVAQVPTMESEVHRAELAAIGLGLVGDVRAVPLLVAALDSPVAALRAAAAEALGRIGAPQAIDGLVAALEDDEDLVRRAAAGALGDIGDPRAAPGLGAALSTAPRLTSRTLAAALLRLGEDGHRTLRGHASPYAAEALAVHGLRGAVR